MGDTSALKNPKVCLSRGLGVGNVHPYPCARIRVLHHSPTYSFKMRPLTEADAGLVAIELQWPYCLCPTFIAQGFFLHRLWKLEHGPSWSYWLIISPGLFINSISIEFNFQLAGCLMHPPLQSQTQRLLAEGATPLQALFSCRGRGGCHPRLRVHFTPLQVAAWKPKLGPGDCSSLVEHLPANHKAPKLRSKQYSEKAYTVALWGDRWQGPWVSAVWKGFLRLWSSVWIPGRQVTLNNYVLREHEFWLMAHISGRFSSKVRRARQEIKKKNETRK